MTKENEKKKTIYDGDNTAMGMEANEDGKRKLLTTYNDEDEE